MSIPGRHSNPEDVVANLRTFFVTSSIFGKRNLLQTTCSAELFIQVLYAYRQQKKYLLHEFVVMPDHFHALLTVGREMTIERAVQLIKGGFAFRAGREMGFHAPVWQKGFSEIRTMDVCAFERQRAYIHDNPVRRHLVRMAGEYPFSSATDRYELDPPRQRLKPHSGALLVGAPEGAP